MYVRQLLSSMIKKSTHLFYTSSLNKIFIFFRCSPNSDLVLKVLFHTINDALERHFSRPVLFRFIIFFVAFVSGLSGATASNNDIIFETAIYHDDSRVLKLPDILKMDSLGLFERINPVKNLGVSSDITWVKVVVTNPEQQPRELFLRWKEGLTHKIYFYAFHEGKFRETRSGHSLHQSDQTIESNAICFPLMLHGNTSNTYFLKIDTPYNKEMNISVVNRRQLDKDEQIFNLFAGAIFCSLFVICLYNLFLGFALRDRLYFHFVAANLIETVASTTMLGLMPVIFSFIPYNTSPFVTTVSVGLFGVFSSNFLIQFLKLKERNKVLYRIMLSLIIIELLAIIIGNISYYAFDGTYLLIAVVNLIFTNVAFGVVIAAFIKGYPDARFLLLGWLILWFGLVMKLLTIIGVLSSSWFSEYFVYTSGVIESILLSFALADRYNRMLREKLQLEVDLQAREKDLDMLVVNNRIRHNERKKILGDLHELARHKSEDLRGSLKSLIFNLTKGLNREEKFLYRSDHIEVLNANFEEKLKTAFPDLSKTEIEICGYIKTNLSVKEMAEMRRTSEGAIKMTRHRLKNKLQLEDQSLDSFIKSEF